MIHCPLHFWFSLHIIETAVNIGYACQLLSDDMTILEESEIWYETGAAAVAVGKQGDVLLFLI